MRLTSPRRASRAAFVLLLLAATAPALAQEDAAQRWTRQKCALYTDAWAQAFSWSEPASLRPAFLQAHQAFLASGCSGEAKVCPRTEAELALANQLSLMALSEGLAGSFLPFACRD